MPAPSSLPSGYLVDQARKEAELKRLKQDHPGVEEAAEAKSDLFKSLVDEALAPSEDRPILDDEEPGSGEPEGKSHYASLLDDKSLTDLEQELARKSERMLRFAWAAAELIAAGSAYGWKKKAGLAAGVPEKHASKRADEYLSHPIVKRVIAEKLPSAVLVKGVSEDWVVAQLATITQRSMQAIPVMDKEGRATGAWVADHPTAIRALSEIAAIKGMKKDKAPVQTPEQAAQANAGVPVELNVDVSGIAKRVGNALLEGLKAKE